MRAAIYARVSSAKQRDAHSIESQLLALRRYVAQQGWTLAGEYIDDGRSAKSGRLELRDGFARLVAAIGTFDVLVVLDVNRLTRTDDMGERARILGPFQAAGIDIVTPSGGRQDLRTMLGELYVTLHALVGAEESRKRTAAIMAGKQRALAEGRKPAGPTPYGLAYTRATGAWSLDRERASIVAEAFRRVIAGESCLAIADDFHARGLPPPRNKWDRHAVWRLVRSRHVVGEWTADKRRHAVMKVPPIIDEDTWQAAQTKLIAHGKRGLVKTKHVYLLEGIARCTACGSPIAIRSATITYRRVPNGYLNPAAYVCRARKLAHRGEVRCCAPIAPVIETDELVWSQVSAALDSRDLAERMQRLLDQRADNRKAWRSDVATYRAKLAKLDERQGGIVARYQRGMIGEAAFDGGLVDYQKQRRAIEAQIKAAEDQAAGRDDVPQVDARRWLRELRAIARNASQSERQRIVRALVKPGSAELDNGVVRLTLLVEAGGSIASDSTRVLAVASGYRTHRGDDREGVAIRVVARRYPDAIATSREFRLGSRLHGRRGR